MNIAFLVSTFPKLSETFILNQVTGLIDAGHEVTVFAHRSSDIDKHHDIVIKYDLPERTIYTGAPTSYPEAFLVAVKTLLSHPFKSNQVLRSIRRGKPGGERLANLETLLTYSDFSEYDAVHAHFGTTAKAFDFLVTDEQFTVGSEVPFFVSFYGYDVSKVISQDPQTYTDLFPLCDAVTALSDDMVSKLANVGCPQEKIVKQQLAIDTDEYRSSYREPTDSEPIKILTVARFTEKKGLEYAIDAIAQLSEDYDLNYRIAGDGPRRPMIEAQIERHGLEDTIELMGWVDQQSIKKALADAHLFLLPSRTASDGDQEGTPTVLLEAQATGLPVISTTHAGIPEIVDDGESGILVSESDTEQLVKGLKEMFRRVEQWPRMGERGRKLVESKHSISQMVTRLENLYQNKFE